MDDFERVGLGLSNVMSTPEGAESFALSAEGLDQFDCEGIVAVRVRAASEGSDDSFCIFVPVGETFSESRFVEEQR